MQNGNLNKGIVIGAIILLLGTGILPSITAYKSNNVTNTNTDTINIIIIALVKNLDLDKYYNRISFKTIICYYFQYENGELTYKGRIPQGYPIVLNFESMKGFAFGIFIFAKFYNVI